jgi:NitT/TauT family transport system substrate-binding protein
MNVGTHHTPDGHLTPRPGRPLPRRLTAGVAASTLLLAPVACGGSDAGPGGTASITLAIPPAVSGIDVYAAQTQGYFTQHHLKVKIKTVNGGSAIVPALASGSVQIGESNVLSVIQGASRGVKEPCIAGANTDPPSGHYLSLLAGPRSGVRGPADLSGKTVAVNATSGINELLTDTYLAAHGVNPASVHFIGLQFPDMPGALKAGRVAAAMTTEPFTTIAMGQGATVLTGTPLASVPGTPTYSCWNASRSWVSSHKAVAAEFVAAMRQTDAYITTHPAEFRAIVGKHLKVSPQAQSSMTLPVFTDKLTRDDVTAWENVARKYKLINSVPAPDEVLMGVLP